MVGGTAVGGSTLLVTSLVWCCLCHVRLVITISLLLHLTVTSVCVYVYICVCVRVLQGWVLVDPICTFIFCILVLFSTVNVLKDALRVVMEGTGSFLILVMVRLVDLYPRNVVMCSLEYLSLVLCGG